MSSPSLFHAPPSLTGRVVTGGLSFVNRIGKGKGTLALWQNERATSAPSWPPSTWPPSTWAAVRQVDLFQEGDNLVIDKISVDDVRRAHENRLRMRAGGSAVTVVLQGIMTPAPHDDLARFDMKLEEEVRRLVSFYYEPEESALLTFPHARALARQEWDWLSDVPDLGLSLGSARVLGRETALSRAALSFMEQLPALGQEKLFHEVAAGQEIPSATKEKNWTFIADPEDRHTAFCAAMHTVFQGLDFWGEQEMAVMSPLRGYGDRCTPEDKAHMADGARLLFNRPAFVDRRVREPEPPPRPA